MNLEPVFILRIDIQSHPGYLCAKSADLPGLHICGETDEQLRVSLVTGIKALFKRNRGLDVEVRPVASSIEAFPRDGAASDRMAVLPA